MPKRSDEGDDPQGEHVTVWTLFPASTDYIPATQPFMINYIVDDLDALLDHLKTRGIDAKQMDESYGRFAWIYDVSGLANCIDGKFVVLDLGFLQAHDIWFVMRDPVEDDRQAPADGVYAVGSDLHWGGKLDYRACWRRTAARQAVGTGDGVTAFGFLSSSPDVRRRSLISRTIGVVKQLPEPDSVFFHRDVIEEDISSWFARSKQQQLPELQEILVRVSVRI